jgi:hypothetical protein
MRSIEKINKAVMNSNRLYLFFRAVFGAQRSEKCKENKKMNRGIKKWNSAKSSLMF